MTGRHRVADYIVGYLAGAGVDYIFGVDGANIEDLYDAAHYREDITAVLAKHEFSAAAMADGHSRGGAGLGVVAATSGGGSLNTVPGLGESLASGVPVLALIGQPPSGLDGQGSFQDTSGRGGTLDAGALFSAVSVFCRRVLEPADILTALPEAVAAALGGGPAVLLLPKDVQQAVIGPQASDGRAEQPGAQPLGAQYGVRADGARASGARASGARASGARQHVAGADGAGVNGARVDGALEDGALEDGLDVLAKALRAADGPITIIAGGQVALDDARDELEALRASLGARVAVVPDAKDVAGTPGRGASAGLGVTGVMGHPGVAAAIADSALCLLVGTRLPITARFGLDEALASVPTFSLGSAEPYPPATHVHTSDLAGTLPRLKEMVSGGGQPATAGEPVPHTELTPPPYDGPGVRYREAMRVLDAGLPDGADIVVDAGNIGAAAIHHLPARRDGRFVVALGMGGMGYSFGAGIGMAFGRRRRTVVIAGDGSFLMHGMEIHTALQYRLPVTFLLFDNHAHGMCVTREQVFYEGRYSYNRFGPSRLGAGLAAMFPGLPSVDVDDAGALAAALSTSLQTGGPSVISVECSADEIPPFAGFIGTSHRDT